MVERAIAIGVLLNALSFEALGLTGGGMVVPGYLAIYLDQPARVLATLALSVIVWLVVEYGLGRFVILYGRRHYEAMLVVGILGSWLLGTLAPWLLQAGGPDARAIGHIVPGLLANEMRRQGAAATLSMTMVLAILTRFVLWASAGFGG